jgi:hypothetical protein
MELGKGGTAESAAVEPVRKFIYKGNCGGKSHGRMRFYFWRKTQND